MICANARYRYLRSVTQAAPPYSARSPASLSNQTWLAKDFVALARMGQTCVSILKLLSDVGDLGRARLAPPNQGNLEGYRKPSCERSRQFAGQRWSRAIIRPDRP